MKVRVIYTNDHRQKYLAEIDDLGNFLGRIPIEFIPVLENVFNEIFEDIRTIVPIMNQVFPMERFLRLIKFVGKEY